MRMGREVSLAGLFLALLALPPGTGQAGAEQRAPSQTTTIVDAGGRVHEVMPMRSITAADRKAAARRAKALREAAAREQGQAPASQGQVKP